MQYEQRLCARFNQHSKALGYCDSERDEMAAAFFYGALIALTELEAEEDWHPEAVRALQGRLIFVCLIGYPAIERALREAEQREAMICLSETRPVHEVADAARCGTTAFSKPERAQAYRRQVQAIYDDLPPWKRVGTRVRSCVGQSD